MYMYTKNRYIHLRYSVLLNFTKQQTKTPNTNRHDTLQWKYDILASDICEFLIWW